MNSNLMQALENALFTKRNETSSNLVLEPKFIINDYSNGKRVLSSIERELSSCDSFSLSVAFITQGGLTPLLQVFDELKNKGIKGRILTTNYMLMTEPRALKALSAMTNIDVRMYKVEVDDPGFHTKGYIFNKDNYLRFIIGSSNITQYALTTNKEWNLELSAEKDSKLGKQILEEFETMFYKAFPINDVLDDYSKLYNAHKQFLTLQKEVEFEAIKLAPNFMQVKFISALQELINSGERRALLISATGTGKTYASAFAVRELGVKRLLFIVHRAQIAEQAIKSYKRIFGSSKTYGLLSGNSKEVDADFVFATMQTLSKTEYLESFDTSSFDFIIIDEVHRAGAESYDRIIKYFNPRFLLGMTATPDRTDGFDIYALFHNNIAYEIRLKDAMEYSLLCPFHYFALTELELDGKVIDDDSAQKDFQLLIDERRVDHIIEKAKYFGYSGERVQGLIFCSTKKEGETLSQMFNDRGYKTAFLCGNDSQEKRQEYISRLVKEENDEDVLDYLFSVDIFNEGVDIPSINQIIMLRPTQSPIIFIQQLGRGLRKCINKNYVVVLDFIGNYSQNYMITQAFSQNHGKRGKNELRETVLEPILPGSSSVHFDPIAKQLILHSIDSAKLNRRKYLRNSYFNLKHKLNKIPNAMDFYNFGDCDIASFIDSNFKAYNLFVQAEDAEYKVRFSEIEQNFINYFSNYLIDGKRIEELLLLRLLIKKGIVSVADYQIELQRYNRPFTVENYQGSIRMLTLEFVNAPSDKKILKDIAFLKLDNDIVHVTTQFFALLQNREFKEVIEDLLSYSEALYNERYSKQDRNNMVLYEKYTRKDVCRLLNWEKDDSSTMYGYRIKYKTCPIFVTYKKEDDISKSTAYEDYFISPSCFNWMTRNKVKLTSSEAIKITNYKDNNLRVMLFVKKSDDEGSDFYYLGEVEPKYGKEETIKNDKGDSLPIVNYKLMLKTEVKENLYNYIRE